MIKKKVCMLGAFAVGKTSLVRQYVHSIFSEKYQTTVGVKIDKKTLERDGGPVDLILWDIHGEDAFQTVRTSYLRGAAGILIVVDGTRRATLDTAMDLQQRARETVGAVPIIFVFNKSDLAAEWELEDAEIERLRLKGIATIKASAKTGRAVPETFDRLAQAMLENE
ncbi:MAG: Rab family GTPase [Desulfobacterales bacterium]|nr:Rab family GTPase [Desulfobacterales bacterium]